MKSESQWLIAAASLVTLSCAPAANRPAHFKWTVSDSGSAPEAAKIAIQGGATRKSGPESIVHGEQRVASARIRGTWSKAVRDSGGKLVQIEGRVVPAVPHHLRGRIVKALVSRDRALAKMKKAVPELAASSLLYGPELELAQSGPLLDSWNLLWVVDFASTTQDRFLRLEADESGKPLRIIQVGSQYVEGVAAAYPESPLRSEIADVVLGNLSGDGSLTGKSLKVASMLPSTAWSPNNIFKYSPGDTRFDDVQVYFFLETALNWFKREAGIDMPLQLDVRVHVGSPEKPGNTAYYYRGNIRLGDGDGRVYRDIPRDPSVVMHEGAHAVVESVAGLPYDGEGGSINEAFADFFAASILGSPRMGEASFLGAPYKRTLENEKTLADVTGALYGDSLILSGALWEVRSRLGAAPSVRLAVKILNRLGRESRLKDIGVAAASALEEGFTPSERASVEEILKKRGWQP